MIPRCPTCHSVARRLSIRPPNNGSPIPVTDAARCPHCTGLDGKPGRTFLLRKQPWPPNSTQR